MDSHLGWEVIKQCQYGNSRDGNVRGPIYDKVAGYKNTKAWESLFMVYSSWIDDLQQEFQQ
ncbi:MAG: hypothetical protein GKR95_13440 [Gammaproteobacteria bacterium]|nr:hypothetical protein [Gammaproteobacteria bacterium]